MGDDHLAAVGPGVVLHRLGLVDHVREVALQRRRRVLLTEIDLVKGLVQDRQGDAHPTLAHALLGDTGGVTRTLIVGEVADEPHHHALPPVTPPRGQPLMRALLV